MTADIAELFLKGRISEQEALELTKSRKRLDKEVDKSCIKMGVALTTMRHTYGFVPKRRYSKYRA